MAGLINIGLTGVLSHQTALNTTGNNITNANTPGYSRQQTLFETQEGRRTGAGSIGSGVNVASIRRLANEYLAQQVREDSTLYREQEALSSGLTRLDNLLGGEATGLSGALNNLFASLQNAAEDPTSLPQRQLVLSEAQQSVNRFRALDQAFVQQRESIKTQMQQGVKETNTLLNSIAALNLAISESPGIAQGQTPNELLDKRDKALGQLSGLISIRVASIDNSQVRVSLSNGLSLVTGSNAASLGTREHPEDPTRLAFTLSNGRRSMAIDEQITGGKLGGLVRFDNEALKPSSDELGRLAIALFDTMNHQHQIGMNLEGELGGLLFADINSAQAQTSRVVANGNNGPATTGRLAVEITDSSKLPAGRWTLQFGGDGRTYELIDQASGETVNQGRLPDPAQSEISMPGFNIRVVDGPFNPGDTYLIQPSRGAAERIGLVVNREQDLAFASPVRATTGDGNIGTGKIDQGSMLNVRNPLTNALLPAFQVSGQLANGPITVTFGDSGAGLVFTVTNASGSPIGPTNRPYTPGVANELFGDDPAGGADYQGFQFRVTGQPADGDTFEINYNANGVSDNRNVKLLAALGSVNALNGASQSFSEGYAGLVEDIGVKTRQSQLDVDAGKTLLEQSISQQASVSGVNLDEEAGRLIQYQAAYNASARVMSVAQDLFTTLLQSFR